VGCRRLAGIFAPASFQLEGSIDSNGLDVLLVSHCRAKQLLCVGFSVGASGVSNQLAHRVTAALASHRLPIATGNA